MESYSLETKTDLDQHNQSYTNWNVGGEVYPSSLLKSRPLPEVRRFESYTFRHFRFTTETKRRKPVNQETQRIAIEQAYFVTHTSVRYRDTYFRHPLLDKVKKTYSPVEHLVGVKAVRLDLKDKHTGTLQYPSEGVVTCSDFSPTATCGKGIHSSLGHNLTSMRDTLVEKYELNAKFQLLLHPAAKTVIVQGNKFKSPMAYVVHTGTFAEIFEVLQMLFPNTVTGLASNLVTQPR